MSLVGVVKVLSSTLRSMLKALVVGVHMVVLSLVLSGVLIHEYLWPCVLGWDYLVLFHLM